MYHEYTQKILSIIENIKNIKPLPALKNLDAIVEGAIGGEWQIDLEDICTNLTEFNIPVTQEIHDEISSMMDELNIDKSYLDGIVVQ